METLIIDPSHSYRRLLSSVLEDHGLNPVGVDSCASAKSTLAEGNFNLICMAMNLPDGNSRDLCLQLRATPSTAHTPILLLTSCYDHKIAERYYAAGITELFKKQDFASFDKYLITLAQREQRHSNINGHILYVEDSKSIASMTTMILEDHGYEVDHFFNAEEGLESFSKNNYDLVLTDIVLDSDLSGLGLVRAIRASESADSAIPIVTMSSFNDDARKLELFNAGANDFVSKPVLSEELLARIDNLVANRQLLKQLERQQKRLQQMALSDHLTGLYNRHFLMDIAPKLMSSCNRSKDDFSILIIDIDHFKNVNDSHGHSVGDEILVCVADLLRTQSRLEDIVARYGGEEFIILLPKTNKDQAITKAEYVRQSVLDANPKDIAITVSIGVGSQLANESDFIDLFNRADEGVYAAKDGGRNQVVFLDPENIEA